MRYDYLLFYLDSNLWHEQRNEYYRFAMRIIKKFDQDWDKNMVIKLEIKTSDKI